MSKDLFSLEGVLLGVAVGDALGLPYEGLSRQRGVRLLGEPGRYLLWPGCGLVSDDTEHSWMVACALCNSPHDSVQFARRLARELKLWVLLLPAGAGRATLVSCCKLRLGVSPLRSGVFSAGNGPAMRAPLLGAAIKDAHQLCELVRISTRMTHTDPKAECGALAVAVAARCACKGDEVSGAVFRDELRLFLDRDSSAAEELLQLVDRAIESVSRRETTAEFADSLGLSRGVSGYIFHTVPVVLHAWLRNQADYRTAVLELIRCGGDADTTAAIVGGIIGARVGKAGIPAEWIDGLRDWPRTVSWTERLATSLVKAIETGQSIAAPRPLLAGILLRNLVFLVLVLLHGFRRLLPPYARHDRSSST